MEGWALVPFYPKAKIQLNLETLAYSQFVRYNDGTNQATFDTTSVRWAMPLIGIRELRERASEVLRQVREEKAEYVITYQGRPVALLMPVDEETIEAAMVEAGKQHVVGGWEHYARLAEQVRQAWPPEQGTQDLLDEIRR